LTGIAALSIFSAFNHAVKSKTAIAVNTVRVPDPQKFAINGQDELLELDVGFTIKELRGRVRFTTQHDAKVDQEICAPLDGQEWDANDPDIVVPPDDTHRFCRCHLIPLID